jgi:DNA-binding phage protein
MSAPETGLLRQRLLEIARRRVPEDRATTMVEEAIESAMDASVRSHLDALRGAIEREFELRFLDESEKDRLRRDPAPDPLESLTPDEVAERFAEALEKLDTDTPNCPRHLRGVTQRGLSKVASTDRIAVDALARRLRRCRHRLESILLAQGTRP